MLLGSILVLPPCFIYFCLATQHMAESTCLTSNLLSAADEVSGDVMIHPLMCCWI
jgi:hypothetical protein